MQYFHLALAVYKLKMLASPPPKKLLWLCAGACADAGEGIQVGGTQV